MPLPEQRQSVTDTRHSAKWHIPLFVSLHLFFILFSSFLACAALSITCFEFAVSKATAIQLQPHNEISTSLIPLDHCICVWTLHVSRVEKMSLPEFKGTVFSWLYSKAHLKIDSAPYMHKVKARSRRSHQPGQSVEPLEKWEGQTWKIR